MPIPPNNAEPTRLETAPKGPPQPLGARLAALGKECAALPDVDRRAPEDIIGYDETGLWR